jgi:hypothetical protein
MMRVQGAIAAFLCLGFGWTHAYHLAASSDPGAFNPAGSDISAVSSWVNYSFEILTTVGYEGIVPVHPVAHTMGSGEAVTGQLYLAVLVARLVSMQILTLRPACLPNRLCDLLHRRLQRLRCLRRCFDRYRVERTSSRAGLTPAVDHHLFTAHPVMRLIVY